MRGLRRHRNRKQIKLVLGTAICLLMIMTVGYAAFSTNITINAKGNLIEPNDVTIGDLKASAVTTGDGLYADSVADRYIYKGTNPNNYIRLDQDLYRIVSIEPDDSIKVAKVTSLGNMAWDSNYNIDNSSNWNKPVTLNTYLNSTFYNSLSTDLKSYITTHTWNVGAYNTTPASSTLSGALAAEDDATWSGKVALVNLSDVLKVNSSCSANYLCNSSADSWTLTPYEEAEVGAWHFGSTINVDMANENYSVRPCFHLKPGLLFSGYGTEASPYLVQGEDPNYVPSGNGGSGGGQTVQKVYAINTSSIYKNTSTLQDIGTTYNSCSATGKNTCIRYTIENDIVTGAEACFVKGGTEYCLKGWVDECLYDETLGDCTFTGTPTVYNANKTTLQTAFTETNACSDYGYDFGCSASGFYADALSGGNVYVNDYDWHCGVDSDGNANCGGGNI